jgi:phage tail sheath protein FI
MLWVKLRTRIETYLTQLWRSGALAGTRPEQAFYVSCGPGPTMTTQDIQQGHMMVEIGMAAVCPAEFIIL